MMRWFAIALAFWATCASAQVPMTGAGKGVPGVAGAAPTVANTARGPAGIYSNPVPISIAVTTGQFCYVYAQMNGISGVQTITVSDGVNTWTQRDAPGTGLVNIGTATSTVTTTTTLSLSVNISGSPSYVEAWAMCVSGQNATPLDSNVSLPAVATSGALTVSTTHATSLVLTGQRGSNGATCTGGWTLIVNVDFGGGCYQKFTSTQTNLNVPDFLSTNNGTLGDAIDGTP